MINYRIDLEKAKKAPHHLYFIKLIWALNDLLSTTQLADYIESPQKIPKDLVMHLQFYLMRLHCAQLVEACKCFVYLVKPTKRKPRPEFIWIAKHKELLNKFDEIRALMDKPLYEKMRNCRDSFIFHYEHEDSSTIIERAFNVLTNHWKKFKTHGPCDLNLISFDDDLPKARYFIADHLMRFAWLTGLDLNPNDSEANKEFHEFRGQILGAFGNYATEAILTWARENKLLTNE